MDIDRLIATEFSRNIGLVSQDEQRLLLATRVAVAGAGGVGGVHLLALARLGLGAFSIADPDIYEAPNINRQFGAFHSTFAQNKAEVMARILRDINPDVDVRVFPTGIDAENVDDFLDDASVYVDGIDFFEIEARRLIFRRCRERGIYAITAAPLGFGATLQVFSPHGMSFDDYFGIDDHTGYLEKIAAFAVGLAPHPYHIDYMDLSRVNVRERTGPAVAPACTLAASLVSTEVVKIITGKGKVRPVPDYLQADLLLNRFKLSRVAMGGKNPIQRLKRHIFLRKLRAAMADEGR